MQKKLTEWSGIIPYNKMNSSPHPLIAVRIHILYAKIYSPNSQIKIPPFFFIKS